jgi:serine/threonine-protein kinase
VLLGSNGVIKLSDFGLARARDRAASLTAPGTVKGKLSYLAPEVTFGKPNSVQSDLFGVGTVLWETLTGERLFDGKTDIEIFRKIRACQVPPLGERRRDVPANFVAVLSKSLAVDPEQRYATADEFAHALAQVLAQGAGSVNTTSALASAVSEAQRRLGKGTDHLATDGSIDVEFSRPDVEPPKPR